MKIATPAQLATRVERSLAWRKKELTQLKFIADSASAANANVLRRSGITLIYAHWEGFVKDSSVYYLKYLTAEPLEVGKLKSCFVAVALMNEIRGSGLTRKISAHSRLVDLIRSLETPPPTMRRLTFRQVISTRSNLKGDVLREITATLGIDYAGFELKEKPVIDRLVTLRNSIAHGGGRPVSEDEYNQMHSEIIALMDHYKDLIQDAAYRNLHLR